MIYLTILNSLAIFFILLKQSNHYFEFKKETTDYENTLLGFRFSLYKQLSEYSASRKKSIYFKIRNKKKTEMKEDARRMIALYSQDNKIKSLKTKFSWLETWDEVNEFKKYYTCVDEKTVQNLVSNFVPK